MRKAAQRSVEWAALMLSMLAGCTGISVAPACPEELEVGQSVAVRANEENPGAIPTYTWEVFPSQAGTFADPSAPVTSFEAAKEGELTIRLTASDGLYQVVVECQISVIMTTSVVVSLTADPDPAVVGAATILSCSSAGETEAVTRTIEQLDGATVSLTVGEEGVATFTPDEVGELTFQCIGAGEDGRRSAPMVLTVSVIPPPDDTDNENDDIDGDRRPPRTGR